ncbi:MAG: hypothetical protein IT161_01925 [Bryobacterales bacterium]|nr:hypothetical protein [Bryobacterales bacterium]
MAIGKRRRPEPKGRPGFLRIDTVHQGGFDGAKGVYHINAVDEVTQWQVMAATPKISERWLIPVLEAMLGQFPFQIRAAFIPTTAASASITTLRACSRNSSSSRPRRAHATPTTTAWWRPRTAR